MIEIKSAVKPSFARHETFTVRYSWLKRGYDAIADRSVRQVADDWYVFNEDDAHRLLGMGKNMARSTRFWLQAYRIVEERKSDVNARLQVGEPTPFGRALFDDETGLDPWLEDTGTWWLLHWMALSPGSHLPVWWSAFHTFPAVVFTTEQLLEHCCAQVEATSAWGQPSRGSIKKDVLALLRVYAGTSGSRRADKIDDSLDAPFVPLSLVRAGQNDTFRFSTGPKPGLPPAVAAFTCLDFLSRTGATSRSALIASLAHEQGGPGRALKLSEPDLVELLNAAASISGRLIAVTATAGAASLVALGDEPIGVTAAKVLHSHYAAAFPDRDIPVPQRPYLPWTANIEAVDAEWSARERPWT